jgi:Fe-S-cluster containining protein
MPPPPAGRADPCSTCGLCCRSYIVPVCGDDVWRISNRQRLAPEQFLIACPQQTPGADGFFLAPGGQAYGLALDKRGRFHPKRPCVFLVELAGGQSRCGVYDHRPVVCQAYPMSLRGTLVTQRADSLCPPGSWTEVEVARPAWRAAQQRQRMRFDVYHEVVAYWNARVAAAGAAFPAARFPLVEYLSYVLNVYARLAALDEGLGPEGLERLVAGWPTGLLPGAEVAAEYLPDGAPDWLAYLRRARRIIEPFYGVAPAAPPPVLVPAGAAMPV